MLTRVARPTHVTTSTARLRRPARPRSDRATVPRRNGSQVRDYAGRRDRGWPGRDVGNVPYACGGGRRHVRDVARRRGFRSAPAVLEVPLHDDLGWDRQWVSAAVDLILFGLVGPFAAALMGRYGCVACVLSALGLIAAAASRHRNDAFAVAVARAVGRGRRYRLRLHGDRAGGHRGHSLVRRPARLVTGALTAATASGQLIFLPLLGWLADHVGWRWVSVTIAVGALLVIPVAARWLRDGPEDLGLLPYGAPMTTSRRRGSTTRSPQRSTGCASRCTRTNSAPPSPRTRRARYAVRPARTTSRSTSPECCASWRRARCSSSRAAGRSGAHRSPWFPSASTCLEYTVADDAHLPLDPTSNSGPFGRDRPPDRTCLPSSPPAGCSARPLAMRWFDGCPRSPVISRGPRSGRICPAASFSASCSSC